MLYVPPYIALCLILLPGQRNRICAFAATVLLVMFALPRRKSEEKTSGKAAAAAAILNVLLGIRFIKQWLPSGIILRLSGLTGLSPQILLSGAAVCLLLCAIPATAQLLQMTAALLKNDLPRQGASGKRYPNLDAIKTFAAVLIVFAHYQQSFSARFHAVNFYDGALNAGIMVELFFMISGFLMVASDKSRNGGYGRQFLSKCLRFYPSVWLSLLAVLLMMAIAEPEKMRELTIPVLLSNFSLCFSGWGLNVGHGLNNPTWYLCVLILCYGLYYLIKLLNQKHRLPEMLIYFVLSMASISFLWVNLPLINYTTLRGYSCFFMGAFLYCAVTAAEDRKRLIWGLSLLAVSAVGLIFNPSDWNLWVSGAFPALLLLAVTLPQMHCGLISELGKASFQLYVWHGPLLKLTGLLFPNADWNSGRKMIVFLAAAYLLAYGIYRVFEIPTSRFIRSKLK